jgi:hypothetical protein
MINNQREQIYGMRSSLHPRHQEIMKIIIRLSPAKETHTLGPLGGLGGAQQRVDTHSRTQKS